jgi:hypothetical protein
MQSDAPTLQTFVIETVAQVRRVYHVEAQCADDAQGWLANNDGSENLVHEEEITEEIDSCALIKSREAKP